MDGTGVPRGTETSDDATAAPSTSAALQELIAAPAPFTLNCIEMVDELFYCSSIGHQFKHYYQYGHLRDCGDKWRDVKMCLWTKTRKAEEAKAAYDVYLAQKEASRPQYPPIFDLRENPAEDFRLAVAEAEQTPRQATEFS